MIESRTGDIFNLITEGIAVRMDNTIIYNH